MMRPDLDDFNEDRYARLLDAAKSRFSFRRLDDDLGGEPIALWRHDIDFSPHRALALARIENQRAVPAAYFVLLSSPFYNAFEPEITAILRDIASLGHDVGLHYDASLLSGDTNAHAQRLAFEAGILSTLVDRPIKAFSLHNPTVSQGPGLDDESHAGLINATSSSLRKTFEYCSDSNGIWRFRSLHDVVVDASVRRLYALTHAEWWTPETLAPAAQVQRCIEGRASRVANDYRQFLSLHRPDALNARRQ